MTADAIGSADFTMNQDWTFEASRLNGANLLRVASPAPAWSLKSVMLNGRDVTDTGIDPEGRTEVNGVEVIFARQPGTELTGSVLDGRNAPLTDYAVLVFPENRSQWTRYSRFIDAGYPDARGQFRITGLPPGRYLAAAVEFLDRGEEREPTVLQRLVERALPVTLVAGEPQTLTLRLLP